MGFSVITTRPISAVYFQIVLGFSEIKSHFAGNSVSSDVNQLTGRIILVCVVAPHRGISSRIQLSYLKPPYVIWVYLSPIF